MAPKSSAIASLIGKTVLDPSSFTCPLNGPAKAGFDKIKNNGTNLLNFITNPPVTSVSLANLNGHQIYKALEKDTRGIV
jgi:hypothetical protein